MSKNDFVNLEVLTSSRHIQHITLHKNFAFLAVTNLNIKIIPILISSFYYYQEM